MPNIILDYTGVSQGERLIYKPLKVTDNLVSAVSAEVLENELTFD